MDLNGGTFSTGGFSETVGALTLSLASTLDFGSGASILNYSNGGVDAWTGLLTIDNWTGTPFVAGGTDQLHFTGITTTNFTSMVDQSEVTWSGFGSGYQIIGSDGSFEIVPVPEPAPIVGGIALLGLAACRERKRLAALLARRR